MSEDKVLSKLHTKSLPHLPWKNILVLFFSVHCKTDTLCHFFLTPTLEFTFLSLKAHYQHKPWIQTLSLQLNQKKSSRGRKSFSFIVWEKFLLLLWILFISFLNALPLYISHILWFHFSFDCANMTKINKFDNFNKTFKFIFN